MAEEQLFWHFIQVDGDGTMRLGFADGETRYVLGREVELGETVTVPGKPKLCVYGLHASKRVWDAFSYSMEDIESLTRVKLHAPVFHDHDKSVAGGRTIVAMLHYEKTHQLLVEWARWCALQVIDTWEAPAVVREYLETGEESIRIIAWNEARKHDGTGAWVAAMACLNPDSMRRTRIRGIVTDAATARAQAKYPGFAKMDGDFRDDTHAEILGGYTDELERRALAAMGLPQPEQETIQ